ncbi:UNVERIFIED_CONTAM: protein O-GlcNAcase, partial [Prevotella sp. 15_C9]
QFRGFIEGYYGNPWSLEDRIDLMKFGGEIKMNQYVFAPKDDPYHNKQWRELYPKADLEKIKKLAQAGNESKCFFVYALH